MDALDGKEGQTAADLDLRNYGGGNLNACGIHDPYGYAEGQVVEEAIFYGLGLLGKVFGRSAGGKCRTCQKAECQNGDCESFHLQSF